MKEYMEPHSMRFPVAMVIFGFTNVIDMEYTFEYAENTNGDIKIKSQGLVGAVGNDGKLMDMEYLLEEDSPFGDFIIQLVLANTEHWDDEEEWWK